ncbi:hypothetical protein GMD78_07430 [Ornithinibacillus sp. L9]|uniref:Uncharacterized protein n=1 Tax=Ornithinibacillus caprae TaxID=2678566 RepID=A0A6N8FEV1_9BACI|nr:hypothetical protein [Ornithinibacillus caprae]MUK88222.1 hypothetical protein [Ornithinibacillus caprae]
MKNKAIYLKVTNDMFWVQLFWAFGVMGVMLIIQIGKLILGINQGNAPDNFYSTFFVVANFFTFIIGIISASFLPYFVGNGVTRKDYFRGATLASIGLAVILPIIALVISVLTQFILKQVASVTFKEPNFDAFSSDSNLIGDIIQFLILTPYVNPESNLMLALGIFSLNILMYYLAGWLIGVAFYRFHTVIGLGFILISVTILTLENVLIRNTLNLPIHDNFSFIDLPVTIAVPVIVLIVLLVLWTIRSLTKNVTIKM